LIGEIGVNVGVRRRGQSDCRGRDRCR